MRIANYLTRTQQVLTRSLVLLGCSCLLITMGNCSLFARESADMGTALPEPGGVRELRTGASEAIPLANPDFEQQWDGWTPRDQEGFSIEAQPDTAHSGQACLRFDCSRQTRYVPSLRQKIRGGAPGVYVLRFWLKLEGISAQTQEAMRVEAHDESGRRVAGTESLKLSAEQIVELDSSAWPPGRYLVEAHSGEFRSAAIVVRKISAEQRRRFSVWFDANQVLHFHGRPAFPLGLYNTTRQFYHRDEEFDGPAETARLEKMAEAPYPLINMKAGQPLTLVGDWTRRARQATFHSRPVWMVIQFFQGWSTDRWPTEEELRTMSLMAITEGARGLLYWSYGARALMSVKDAQPQQEYWRRLVHVARELRLLEPALVAADANESVTSVSDPRLRWLARVAADKCYVFAYLPAVRFVADSSAAERTEVRFILADGQTITRTFRPDSADWFSVSFSRVQSR